MKQITAFLESLSPFIYMVALVFGALGAFHALADIIPILKSIWSPRGNSQMAYVGAALAIIAGAGTPRR